MLHLSKLPASFWSYAQQTSAYIHNWLPHSCIHPKMLLEMLFNQSAVPEYIYPFGACMLVFKPEQQRISKLDMPAEECFMVGYPVSDKGWIFYSDCSKNFFQLVNMVFPDFQHLPKSVLVVGKNDVNFLLNCLMLGEVPTNQSSKARFKHIKSTGVYGCRYT